MKKKTIKLIAIGIGAAMFWGAILSILAGCQRVDSIDELGLDTVFDSEEPVEDGDPRFWLVLESAEIVAWKVDTADYLPDPWAAVYRLGDQMGTTASCDMETYEPVWEDHVTAHTMLEYLGDEWTIVLYDYELSPSGNNQLGSCVVDATAGEIEHLHTVHLEDCQGAVDSIVITFERYDGAIDTEAEKNPNC
jgi:hypothetical protein